jgi:hypothetical protein
MVIDRHEEIFAGFLNREYNYELNNAYLMFEINVLRPCGMNRDAYLRADRKGALLPLNRKKRNAIFDLWENALNHALAEAEMAEAGY